MATPYMLDRMAALLEALPTFRDGADMGADVLVDGSSVARQAVTEGERAAATGLRTCERAWRGRMDRLSVLGHVPTLLKCFVADIACEGSRG